MRGFLIFLLLLSKAFAQVSAPAIGTWREHLPYGTAIDITASANRIYAATPFSLFSVDLASEEIERFSKVSGLSETGISTIQFDRLSQKLWVGYTNSNIDILTSKGIINLPDLKRETVNGDKTIHHFFPDNNTCYASTGLGVIVLDADKSEIKDSWIIGNGGRYVNTYMFTKDALHYYAATEEGLKRTPVTNNNPADYRSWETISGTNGLAASSCKGVVNVNNKIIAWQNDSLFVLNGSNWNLFFRNGVAITSINSAENRLALTQKEATGNAQVMVLNSDGTVYRSLQHAAIIHTPEKALVQNGMVWVADSTSGLSRWSGNDVEQYLPNAPVSVVSGSMTWHSNTVYATAGEVTANWQPKNQPAGLYQYSAGQWTNLTRFTHPSLSAVSDLVTAAIDPRDESVWLGSFNNGLLHIKANQINIIQQAPLSAAMSDPASIRISGLTFDGDRNLWISNFNAATYLHVLKQDNTWQSFTAPFGLNNNAVSQLIVDDANQLWIVSPGNGLLLFNHNNTIDNKTDDRWYLYRSGRGNGNLPSNEVLSIAKDKSGYIWVGTTDGVGIIQCPQDVFSSIGCEALLPITQQGNFANYLFKGEEVKTIAVDGADRKWVGTKNGVWLINAEGDKVMERFTEENSPLPSNDIKQITIDGSGGEVFIATAKGLIAYKGTATEATVMEKELFIYPNPVPPSYTGTIAIKGLLPNSSVKITELNGRLVYQTRSLGGQAVWNGKDANGRNISTGVYLVLVTDEQQQERAAGKIVFIAK